MVLRYSNVRKEFKQELSLARDWNQLPPVYDTGSPIKLNLMKLIAIAQSREAGFGERISTFELFSIQEILVAQKFQCHFVSLKIVA